MYLKWRLHAFFDPVCLFVFCVAPLLCQPRVSLRNTHERLLCVVDVVGSGTAEDPYRPRFAPAPPKSGEEPNPNGIIAYNSEVSDDGRLALVEFVARDRSAFAEILAANRQDVKVFEKGKARREDIEREFRKYKKDFDFSTFEVGVP